MHLRISGKRRKSLQTAFREVFEETQIQENQIRKHTYSGPFYPETEEVIF